MDESARAQRGDYEALFDQTYYQKACGRHFRSWDEAFAHYRSKGEAEGRNPGPFFDVAHYRRQTGGEAGGLLRHYVEVGHRQGLDPTRFFDQAWYNWQNPDSMEGYANPYLHYLKVGRAQGRDPSPLVDMIRYQQQVETKAPAEDHYRMILEGVRSVEVGVYEDWPDLEDAQARFRGALNVYAAKVPPVAPRRNLVFLQCGRQSRHREWLTQDERNFDLLVNYYDYTGFDPEAGEYIFFQPGTKFTAIAHLWSNYRELLLQYEYILFLDDDIMVSVPKLNRLFQVCAENQLDLAQMSLSKESHGIWSVFFARPGSALRHVSGVEIMMPVLSRHAMIEVGEDFNRSVSGFGIDLLLGKRLLNEEKSNIAVVDEVVADHLKPVDPTGGGYYAYMRSCLINPKAELWRLITEFGLERGFVELG